MFNNSFPQHNSINPNNNNNNNNTNNGRISDMLETIKKEFDNLTRDVSRYKSQRDEYERKVQSQVTELSAIKNTLTDLERKHTNFIQTYQEEIARLRGPQQSTNERPFDLRRNENTPSLPSIMQKNDNNYSFPNPKIAPLKSPQSLNTQSSLGKRSRNDENHINELPSIQATKIRKYEGMDEVNSSSPNITEIKKISDNSPLIQEPSITKSQESIPLQSKVDISLAYELDHNSVVCCVKYSPDGKYLATGSNRKAQIYSVETGEKIRTYTDPSWSSSDLYFRSVCFSPDGKYLACGTEDKTVKLWDIEKEETIHTFIGHTMDIYSLDYSSDGKFIVSGSGDKQAKVWDVENKNCLYTLGNDEVGPKDGVTSIAISPDGRLIAAGSLDKIVRLWDAQTGYFLERYEGHDDSVYSVAFSPDGKSLASGSLDKTVKIWDLSESRSRSRCKSTFNGHSDFVLSVAFSHDGNWLISGSKDRTVKFWDPRTVTNQAQLEGHKNSVISVAVNPSPGNKENFATGSGDNKAKVWHFSHSSV